MLVNFRRLIIIMFLNSLCLWAPKTLSFPPSAMNPQSLKQINTILIRCYKSNKRGLQNKKKDIDCRFCAKPMRSLSVKKIHERTHTGVKPFSCQFCERTFICQSKKNRHERIHTKEKPHICSLCSKAFTEKCNLVTHVRTHTGQKPYKCIFVQRFSLNKGI